MAYERTTWKPDDLVTSGKMNNIEAAIVELNTVDATSDARIEANETAINLINEKIGTNNGAIGTINERIKTNADNIETIDNEIVSLHQEDSNINKKIDKVEYNYKSSDTKFNLELEALKSQGVTGYKGQYDENTIYKLGDIVSDNANFYIYVNDEPSSGQALNDNNTYWEVSNTALVGSTIEVGENEPENDNVKLWINSASNQEYIVPTIDEFEPIRQYACDISPLVELNSAPIISIDNAAPLPLESLSFTVKPVQNTHGYGSAWLAGGGKNKLQNTGTSTVINGVTFTVNDDGSIVANGTATANANFYVNGNSVKSFGGYLFNGCPDGGSNTTYFLEYYDQTTSETTRNTGSTDMTIPSDTDGHSCRIVASIRNGYTASNVVFRPMLRLATETDATFAPYSNICPITGWDGAEVTRTGKNLFDGLMEIGQINPDDGTNREASAKIRCIGFIPVLPNTEYTLSRNVTTGYVNFRLYGRDKSYLGTSDSDSFTLVSGSTKVQPMISGVNSCTFMFDNNVAYFRFQDNTVDLSAKYQLELGSTATAFESYQGSTLDITFPYSIGEGIVNLITGKLTINKAIVNLETLDWTLTDGTGGTYMEARGLVGSQFAPASTNAGLSADIKCSHFIAQTANYIAGPNNTGSVIGLTPGGYIRCKYDNFPKDAELFQDSVEGVTLVYPLANPITVDLTPQNITMLNNINRLWANCGEITLKYRKNVMSVINDMLPIYINCKIYEDTITAGSTVEVDNIYQRTMNAGCPENYNIINITPYSTVPNCVVTIAKSQSSTSLLNTPSLYIKNIGDTSITPIIYISCLCAKTTTKGIPMFM